MRAIFATPWSFFNRFSPKLSDMNSAPESCADTGVDSLDRVKAALLENPDWLADDADLHALAQAACGNVVDLEAAAIKRLERRARKIADAHRSLRAVARANLAVQSQIHACALSVMDAASARELDDLLAGPLPARLGLDYAAALIEGEVPPNLSAIRTVREGLTDETLGRTRTEMLGRVARGRPELFGEAGSGLRSQALVRIAPSGRTGLFVLGSRDPHAFGENQGTELVNFLARVIERRLGAWTQR